MNCAAEVLEPLFGEPIPSQNDLVVAGLVNVSAAMAGTGKFHSAGGKAAQAQLLTYALIEVLGDSDPLLAVIKSWGAYSRDCHRIADEDFHIYMEGYAAEIETASDKMRDEIWQAIDSADGE